MQSAIKTPENNSKSDGETKTSEETVMKTLRGSPKKTQEFLKLGAKKFHFLKNKKHFSSSESYFLKFKVFSGFTFPET